MSASIGVGKLKFTVFGLGYDDERGDSGTGLRDGGTILRQSAYAAIDETGAYCWLVEYQTGVLRKIDMLTLEEVDKGELPDHCAYLNYPKNVPNNLGIAYDTGDDILYIFDLTTNEIISQGSVEYEPTGKEDCILVDDELRFFTLTQGRARNYIKTLSIDDLSMTSVDVNDTSAIGFTDNSHLYCFYPKEWFYQKHTLYLIDRAGNPTWSITDSTFDNIQMSGLTRDGKIYLPCLINGTWVMGEFPQTPAPDVLTPAPIRTFGEFESAPGMIIQQSLYVTYSADRNMAAFSTNGGKLYITDFEDVYEIADNGTDCMPLAISDDTLIYSDAASGTTEVVTF